MHLVRSRQVTNVNIAGDLKSNNDFFFYSMFHTACCILLKSFT